MFSLFGVLLVLVCAFALMLVDWFVLLGFCGSGLCFGLVTACRLCLAVVLDFLLLVVGLVLLVCVACVCGVMGLLLIGRFLFRRLLLNNVVYNY